MLSKWWDGVLEISSSRRGQFVGTLFKSHLRFYVDRYVASRRCSFEGPRGQDIELLTH